MNRLREYRLATGLSMTAFSKLCIAARPSRKFNGVNTHCSKHETGKSRINEDTAVMYAEILSNYTGVTITVADLFSADLIITARDKCPLPPIYTREQAAENVRALLAQPGEVK